MLAVEGCRATLSHWTQRSKGQPGPPNQAGAAVPLHSLQHWCGDSSALHHPPWLLPPVLCLKLLQCLTLPINISEIRQTTLLARVPSIFHGIEPSAVPSTLPSLAKDYRDGARGHTYPPLAATHPTALRMGERRCLYPREGPYRAGRCRARTGNACWPGHSTLQAAMSQGPSWHRTKSRRKH